MLQADREVDARGLNCPLPIMRSKNALNDMASGQTIRITSTLAGMLLSALAQPLFKLPRTTFAACFQCGFRFNTYVALAAVSRLGGVEGVALMSLLIGVLVPLVNVAAVAMLAREHGARVV